MSTKRSLSSLRRRVIRRVLLDDSPACYWCGRPLVEATVTIDHFVPISCGGDLGIDNCVPACRPCNEARGGRMPIPDEFEAWRRLDRSRVVAEYGRRIWAANVARMAARAGRR